MNLKIKFFTPISKKFEIHISYKTKVKPIKVFQKRSKSKKKTVILTDID